MGTCRQLVTASRITRQIAAAEMVVWRVPTPVPPSDHGFNYRLVCVVGGKRVLGFDNERGKGDHRHEGDHETPYQFTGVEQLVADFIEAVTQWRLGHGKA